jgi:hypothetical protein
VALVTVVNVLSGAQPTTLEKSKDIAAENGIVKVGDAGIEYLTRGKGQAIVLLPGGTLTVGYLDGLADELSKAGYRVVGIKSRSPQLLRQAKTRLTVRKLVAVDAQLEGDLCATVSSITTWNMCLI